MISIQSSTHSLQMNTFGPAISFRTSCWLFPQKEQYRVFFESLELDDLLMDIILLFDVINTKTCVITHLYFANCRVSAQAPIFNKLPFPIIKTSHGNLFS